MSSFCAALAMTAMLGTGCVSIPMGTEKYTAEFPSGIRTMGVLSKSYRVDTDVREEPQGVVTVGLAGVITSTLAQSQHYKSVTVEKRKRLAFGFGPGFGSENQPENFSWRSDKKLLESVAGLHYKNDVYEGTTVQQTNPLGMYLYIPIALLYEPFFGKWECDSHHWIGRNSGYLKMFSPEERRKIGAWTTDDNEAHPQTWFRSGFTHAAAFGFHRYCDYEIHDPVDIQRETPVASKVATNERKVPGPYSVTLELPALGFTNTVDVANGQTSAAFTLPGANNGLAFANGTIRFRLPPGGLDAVRNEDDRALLKIAAQRDWPVAVSLPAQ